MNSANSVKIPSYLEVGQIGIFYLKRIWAFITQSDGAPMPSEESKYLHAVCNALGIGLEPTLQHLYLTQPSFEAFENWAIENGVLIPEVIANFNAVVSGEQLASRTLGEEEKVLTEADLAFWDENGYVIIKQAIPKEDSEQSRKVVYDFLGASENNVESWYQDHPAKQGIMVQLFNNELLNKNRMSLRIKRAYQQLWNRPDLLVSMDRVSFNPPESEQYHFPGPNLHWDVSLKRPIPFGLQGLLYLSDTSVEQGAFTLVPGFHKRIDAWLDKLPKDANPRTQDFAALGPQGLAGEAGDFIIWHQALPHGSCPNKAALPRIVQYINYQPTERFILHSFLI